MGDQRQDPRTETRSLPEFCRREREGPLTETRELAIAAAMVLSNLIVLARDWGAFYQFEKGNCRSSSITPTSMAGPK